MADIFTPPPPAAPTECAVPPPAPRSPTPKWLADYFGPRPTTPTGPATVAPFLGDGWPIPPPGRSLEYLGFQQILNTVDFGLTVPSDEIWHMRTVILDVNFGSSTATRSLQLEVTGPDTSPIFGDYGNTETVTASAGGSITWSQNVVNGVTKFNRFIYPLPSPFFLYPTWQIQAQINVKPSGDVHNTAYFLYDAFKIIPIPTGSPTGGGGGTPTGGGGNPFGGPFFVEG